MKKKVVWGEKRYYTDWKDNSFMKTIVLREKKIKNNYQYVPCWFVRFFQGLFYYVFALPILTIMLKVKYGVKVYEKRTCEK